MSTATGQRTRNIRAPHLESFVLTHIEACTKTLGSIAIGGNGSHSLAGALATLPRKHKTMLERRYDYLPNTFEKRNVALEIISTIHQQTNTTFTHTQIMQHWSDLKRLHMPRVRRFFGIHFPRKLCATKELIEGLLPETAPMSISLVRLESLKRIVAITKQDNEPFGFEIQTYRLQYELGSEMKTYVCRVHDNSPSSRAGLKAGDLLTNINGVSTEGFNHQETVELIRSSGNFLRVETEMSSDIKRSELQARLLLLRQDVRSKWKELQSTLRKEHQLLYGTVNEQKIQEELNCFHSKIFEDPTACSFLNKHRKSSCSSAKSSITLNSEEGLWSTSEYGEDSGPEAFSRQSSTEDEYFINKRNGRSISVTSSESEPMSPNWDTISLSNVFGTLPRKGRRISFRRQFLKFIPGLQRPVEEEESPV